MKWPASIFNQYRVLVVLFASLLALPPVRAGSLLETMDNEVTTLYAKSKDAIVRVHAELPASSARTFFGAAHRVGTGFFIDGEGRLVTAGTLVDGADKCSIEWRGQRIPAKLLGRDPLTNLALLQIATNSPTPSLPLGDSDDLRVGSMVVAIGFSYDQPSAPVVGFVGGLDINCGKRVFPVSYVRAGCRLRPGQGGGPLLNPRGDVVGIVIAAHAEDQCYALPVNAVKKVCADITEHGAPQYGWVGLNVVERQIPVAASTGSRWQVCVKAVGSNTPAAKAGFREEDVLIRICTKEIRRSADVLNTMFYRRCGESVAMAVIRDGATQELTIAVAKRPPEPEQPIADSTPARGVSFQVLPVLEHR